MAYREGAKKYYDLFSARNDAPFYIELAHRHGDRSLELGVGSARLAIQLARAGIEIWGIDNSPHMLRAAEAKLAREPTEVRSRIHLALGDVRDFDLGELFGLIYFPSFSFDHLTSREDQSLALRCIRRHLAPDGIYAFDLANVHVVEDLGWFVQRRNLNERRTVVRVGYNRVHPEKTLMSIDLWYELYEDGRMLERYHEGGDVYIHAPEGVRYLLEENGFKVEAVYGGYNRRPFTADDEMMVFVTRPDSDAEQAEL